jgi:Roadblock/LC7 domain
MAGTLTPARTAERLCELSADARAAVLLDAAGSLAGAHGLPKKRSRELGELARTLFEAVDRAHRDMPGGPPEQVEAQVEGGSVYASRTPRWTLAVVGRRGALSSLMLMDLRAVLGELEGGPPIRRSTPAERAPAVEEEAPGPATEEVAASELPVPELGKEAD